MQEPELEEEMLRAAPQGEQIMIERRSLDEVDGDVAVIAPSGDQRAIALENAGDGIGNAQFRAEERGLYRVEDGELVTYAAVRPISSLELADMRATSDLLTPLTETTGGATVWLAEDDVPTLRKVGQDRATNGRDWLGFLRNERYLVTGVNQLPLLPPLLALLLLLSTLGLAWYREGR
ncbi:MAG: hypothetical protein ACR2RE_22060, partial [Geminicoccaceae bacterium]